MLAGRQRDPQDKVVAEMTNDGIPTSDPGPAEGQPSGYDAWAPEPSAPREPVGPQESPAAPMAPPAPARRGRYLGVFTSVAALAVAAGAVGYAIGDRGTSSGANPYRSFSFHFPFGNGSQNNQLPNGFGGLPGFGGFPGSSSTVAVPAAVKRSEGALVDITVDGGAATGIVLTSDGVVLTNNHVVDGATTITATDLGNSRSYPATVLGYDVSRDVALIKLEGASGLQTASFDTSPSTGTRVYAVGNAGGGGGTPTVTSGRLTSLNASVSAADSATGSSEHLSGMLETNALVIPGDSGGALTTSAGKVLGMDTAGGSNGGFAVPATRVLDLAGQIEAGHASSDVHVGATAILGVEISTSRSTAYVLGVVQGTAAASAGIGAGSTIDSVDGRTTSSSTQLRSVMLSLRVGERVKVTWTTSSGASKSATVSLTSGPAQ